MNVLEGEVVSMVKFKGCSPPHEQVTFIKLKQVIADIFVQSGDLAESKLKHSYRKPSGEKGLEF